MLKTETRNPKTMHLDRMSTAEMLRVIQEENFNAVKAVDRCLDAVARAVDAVTDALRKGGRLIYAGAGTSGRLGVLDASEACPTFGIPEGTIRGVMAGGVEALYRAGEPEEDSAEFGDRGFGGRSGPISWALAVPVVMDALLRHYGDTRALAHYDTCARYVRLVAAKFPGGILPACIGDHEALERAPDALVATAHWHEFVRLTAEFAHRLGRSGDEAEFRALAAKIRVAFAARWTKPDGTVGNGTQSAQAIGIYLGLVPDGVRGTAFAKLVAAVEAKRCVPTTGIFSTRYMLLALSENGRTDLARRMVLQRGATGWMHMLDRGATTLWETWRESDDVYSNCHPMFGSVDEWIIRFGAAR